MDLGLNGKQETGESRKKIHLSLSDWQRLGCSVPITDREGRRANVAPVSRYRGRFSFGMPSKIGKKLLFSWGWFPPFVRLFRCLL